MRSYAITLTKTLVAVVEADTLQHAIAKALDERMDQQDGEWEGAQATLVHAEEIREDAA